jgi:tetratricopeptide (TPR) repeat protein
MWTYFILLLSAVAIVMVFARRTFLLHVRKQHLSAAMHAVEKNDEVEDKIKAMKVSKSDQSKIDALLEQADSLLKRGEEDEAIKVFVQALAINDSHVDTQQKLAMLYLQKQMFGAAAALFKQLSYLTNDPIHFSHLGFVLFQQNSYEEARDAYQKAVDLDPSRAQRFVSLAQVYRSMGQLQNAVIALNKAIELDPEDINFLLLLTEIYAEMNNVEEAETVLRNILERAPDNEDASKLLDRLRKEKDAGNS